MFSQDQFSFNRKWFQAENYPFSLKNLKSFLVLNTNIFHKTKVSTAVLILNIFYFILRYNTQQFFKLHIKRVSQS